MNSRWIIAGGALLLMLTSPAVAQQDSLPPATHARQGMIIGGLAGGAAGAILVGLLAQGQCEYECDGAFLGGMLYGGPGGAVLGGLTGLVIGAALPRSPSAAGGQVAQEPGAPPGRKPADPEAVGLPAAEGRPWTLRLALGPAWSVHSRSGGTEVWVSLAALRPTSSRVHWGVEAGYLGARRQVDVFTLYPAPGETLTVTNTWDRRLWSASLLALRTVGQQDRPAGYLLATAGVYPYQEVLDGIRTGDPPDAMGPSSIHETSTDPLPGLGVGGGGRWRVGERVGLGLDSRLHLILGAGDDLGIVVASLGAMLSLGR